MVGFNGQTYEYNVADIAIENTGDTYDIAQMQTHSTYGNRVEVIKEASLATMINNGIEISFPPALIFNTGFGGFTS